MDFKKNSEHLIHYLDAVLISKESKISMVEVYLKEAYNTGLLEALTLRNKPAKPLETNPQA